MSTFFLGVGVALAIEGLLYAAFPGAMQRMMSQVLQTPEATLRTFGVIAAAFGILVAWLAGG